MRLVLGPDGDVVPDVAGGAFGRGAWVHPRPECLASSVPRGLERALRGKVTAGAAQVTALLRQAGARRLLGLVSAARRARKAAVGSTAVKEALQGGRAKLVIVAVDARSAADTPGLEQAVRAGMALAFGNKAELGNALGQAEVGVVAITDDGLAQAIGRAHALTVLAEPRAARESGNLSTEAR